MKASFFKDADLIGKQDPYIQFFYNNKKVRTDTKDDAGKNPEFNERFCLTHLDHQLESGKRFVLEAFDHDVDADDSLGKTKGMSFVYLILDEEEHVHELKLYDDESKETGAVTFKTRFIVPPPVPKPNPKMNRNCLLQLQIVDLSTFKDADTFGKQDPFIQFKYNNEIHQTQVA